MRAWHVFFPLLLPLILVWLVTAYLLAIAGTLLVVPRIVLAGRFYQALPCVSGSVLQGFSTTRVCTAEEAQSGVARDSGMVSQGG